jgi:hypothetical protein
MIKAYFQVLQFLRLHYLETVDCGCREYGGTLTKAAQNVIENQRRDLRRKGAPRSVGVG